MPRKQFAVFAVGPGTGSASPNGTFDQGGNVSEWSETIGESGSHSGSFRGMRGGFYANFPSGLAASFRVSGPPRAALDQLGFRVAGVIPEPSTALLMGLGLAGFRHHGGTVMTELFLDGTLIAGRGKHDRRRRHADQFDSPNPA